MGGSTMKQRYDSYKHSGIDWIGDIPSHWKLPRVKQFVKINNGSDPKTEGDIPVYGSGSCSFKTCGEFKLGPTVLLGRKGATLHIPHWIEGKYWNVDTAFDTNIIGNLNLRLFFYFSMLFNYEKYKSETTLPSMTQTDYGNMYIPLPPLAEQEAIAAWLDEKCGEIDAAIAKVDREIELIDELKQSEISRVVTRGLNPDAPLRPSGIDWIGNIPEHWKVAPIKNSFILYAGATPKTERAEFWDGDIVWITPADYKTDDHFIKEGRKNITKEGLASCATGIVPIDSLIFSKRAPIGTVAIASIPLCTNQGCISCVPKSISHSNYFYYLCRIATSEFEILGSGATFLEISSSNFANFKMPLPPLSEQQAIADYLDWKCAEIDGLKVKLTKKRETLKELRQSIISEVVTGKRKVI